MSHSGGMRVGLEHPLEKHLLEIFELNEARLFRLSRFLLAHAALDRFLIFIVAAARLRKARPQKMPPTASTPEQIAEVLRKLSGETFRVNLKRAIDEIPLSEDSDAVRIARAINRARNEFLHYDPHHPVIPTYRDKDITTDEGLDMCLDDVLRVLHLLTQQRP